MPVRTLPRFADSQSIGRRSRALKMHHLMGRIWRVIAGVVVVILAAAALAPALGGISFVSLMATALACVLAAALLLRHPRLRVPTRAELATGTMDDITGQAELWLEARRHGLPPAAQDLIDRIGVQLDSLGLQLDRLGPRAPRAEIGRLLSKDLPAILANDATAPHENALIDGLARFSGELDALIRQLASGSTDDLAIKARYIDYSMALRAAEP